MLTPRTRRVMEHIDEKGVDKVVDTMYHLPYSKGDSKELDDIFQSVGIEAKSSHGCQIYDWWKANRFDNIEAHCKTDVSKHRELCNMYGL